MKTSLLRWMPAAFAGCVVLAAFAGCELPAMPEIVVEKDASAEEAASPGDSTTPQPSADENTKTSPTADDGDQKTPQSENGPKEGDLAPTPPLGEAEPPLETSPPPVRTGNDVPPGSETGGETPESADFLIRLSTGVALPQNLPEIGTSMFFSVDYKFVRNKPDQSSVYYMVIIPARSGTLSNPAKLKSAGNLVTVVPGLKPEAGPFRARLEAKVRGKSKRIISNTILLQRTGG